MRFSISYILIVVLLLGFGTSFSTPRTAPLKSIQSPADSLPAQDTLMDSLVMDSLVVDSLALDSLAADSAGRKPFLDDPIFGTNSDSLVYDIKNKKIYVYRDGDIKYQNIGLKADYMHIGTADKLIHAEGMVRDTTKKVPTRPVFTQGEQTYDVDSMDYNMDSGQAYITGVKTKEGEGTLFGGEVKKMKDNVIHMHNGRYTVCDAECPHFYLQMTKGSVIPGKQTVFGPAYMVFEDVPIYFLGVPFGFFPQKSERNSGFIIPEIGEEQIKGFFVRNGGFYFAINDYVDLRLLGGWYTMGSWQLGAASNYSKRYTFNGNFSFDYASDKIGDKDSPDYVEANNINIRWTHVQDPKFRPSSTFSASVNYSSSSYNKYNAQNMNDYLNSQTTSAITYQKNWVGKPFSLAINGAMSQNSQDSTITLNLPTLAFNVTRIAPFKRKVSLGKEKWYEKISFTYNFDFKTEAAKIKEKELFKQEMFDKVRMGMQHNIPISASFNVLQYLNISPSINYNEKWYFRKIDQRWDEDQNTVVSDTARGFYRVYNYNAALSFNTKIYGMYTFGKKKPTFLRHTLTPTVSASFAPDFGHLYWKSVQTDKEGTQLREYSPFTNEMYGVPGRGRTAAINFGLSNTLELKVPTDKDTTGYKKVKIFESFNISSSYNFLLDSLNLAPFNVSVSTNLFNKLPLSFSAVFDPYQVKDGRKINRFMVEDGGFLRLTSLSFSLGYSFQSKQSGKNNDNSGQPAVNNPHNNTNDRDKAEQAAAQNDFFNNQNQERPPSSMEQAMLAANQYYDFSIPWSFSFSYSFSYTNYTGTPLLQQSLNLNGSLNITKKWAITASGGYDFQQKKLTPATVQITRDLHCWQMSFSWQPIGFRQSWSFQINVKSSMLSDVLKYKKNNSFLDNYYNRY